MQTQIGRFSYFPTPESTHTRPEPIHTSLRGTTAASHVQRIISPHHPVAASQVLAQGEHLPQTSIRPCVGAVTTQELLHITHDVRNGPAALHLTVQLILGSATV